MVTDTNKRRVLSVAGKYNIEERKPDETA